MEEDRTAQQLAESCSTIGGVSGAAVMIGKDRPAYAGRDGTVCGLALDFLISQEVEDAVHIVLRNTTVKALRRSDARGDVFVAVAYTTGDSVAKSLIRAVKRRVARAT